MVNAEIGMCYSDQRPLVGILQFNQIQGRTAFTKDFNNKVQDTIEASFPGIIVKRNLLDPRVKRTFLVLSPSNYANGVTYNTRLLLDIAKELQSRFPALDWQIFSIGTQHSYMTIS